MPAPPQGIEELTPLEYIWELHMVYQAQNQQTASRDAGEMKALEGR